MRLLNSLGAYKSRDNLLWIMADRAQAAQLRPIWQLIVLSGHPVISWNVTSVCPASQGPLLHAIPCHSSRFLPSLCQLSNKGIKCPKNCFLLQLCNKEVFCHEKIGLLSPYFFIVCSWELWEIIHEDIFVSFVQQMTLIVMKTLLCVWTYCSSRVIQLALD